MKILAVVAMAAGLAGMASARNIEVFQGPRVPVCVENPSDGWASLIQAEGLASKMFATAGVAIEWRGVNNCPADGIRVSMSTRTRATNHPDSLGYALPYEGTHVVLFWDRVRGSVEPRVLSCLAAHVLVHELTHTLQGVVRHSATGVMKPEFTLTDISQMKFRPLPFTEEDIQLIQNGLRIRQALPVLVAKACGADSAESGCAPLNAGASLSEKNELAKFITTAMPRP
jgi:hypothetical protein